MKTKFLFFILYFNFDCLCFTGFFLVTFVILFIYLFFISPGFDAWLSSHSAGGEINRNSSSRKGKAQPIVKIDTNDEINEVETTYEEDMNALNDSNNHGNDFDSSNIDREYASAEIIENEEVEIPTPLMIKKELIKSRAKAAREFIRC